LVILAEHFARFKQLNPLFPTRKTLGLRNVCFFRVPHANLAYDSLTNRLTLDVLLYLWKKHCFPKKRNKSI